MVLNEFEHLISNNWPFKKIAELMIKDNHIKNSTESSSSFKDKACCMLTKLKELENYP